MTPSIPGHVEQEPVGLSLPLRSRREVEEEIARRVAEERERLITLAVPRAGAAHFRRPAERPFTASERDTVTILIGGLTWKHEHLIRAVFQSAGYKVEILPTPDVQSFQPGKEYGNNGQCNPTYFMVGHLIKFLQGLEASGMTRQEIIDRYVFFTAGSCGPCRFGMYESEYRLGVQNAGFDGFRILLFQQNDGIKAASGEPGLKFTVDFGLGALSALNLGDIINDVSYQIRPYEVVPGETDRVLAELLEDLSARMRDRRMFEALDHLPRWLAARIASRRTLKNTVSVLGKIADHWYGRQTRAALAAARERLSRIEVDRLRVKPLVKVTGEFFAQTTEGDGNFRMFSFLEREGAQVQVEPIGNWIMYLLYQARERYLQQRRVSAGKLPAWQLRRRAAAAFRHRLRLASYAAGRRIFERQYERMVEGLGGIGHPLSNMQELADLAAPYYHRLARGGEGHLEVAKNIYYTVRKKAHMVLSLKPFGCMPSSQSDGVQSAVMSHFKDMIFLPIETSGEGEINAHSRVQMALGEAKAKARAEFAQALDSTGRALDEIKAFVQSHPVLHHPFYPIPHRDGVTGTAARFLLHVAAVMDGRERLRHVPEAPPAARITLASAARRAAAL